MKYYVQEIEPNRFYGFTIVLQNPEVSSDDRKHIRKTFRDIAEPVFQGVREQFQRKLAPPRDALGDRLVDYELGIIYSPESPSLVSAEQPLSLQSGKSYIVFALLQTGRTTTGEFEGLPDSNERDENYRQIADMVTAIYRKQEGKGKVGVMVLYNAWVQPIVSERGFRRASAIR